MPNERVFRAGDEVEDLCRACKIDRLHTVIVVDGAGSPLRVQCGVCQSQQDVAFLARPALGQMPVHPRLGEFVGQVLTPAT